MNSFEIVPILPNSPSWHSEIGMFIMNFGFLDYHLFEFLDEHLQAEKFEAIRKRHFRDRLDTIRDCLINERFSDQQLGAYDGFAARVEEIRRLRNHIAHGHIFIQGSLITKEPPTLTLCNPKDIYNEDHPTSIRLSFSDLNKTNGDLCELIEQFRNLTEPRPL